MLDKIFGEVDDNIIIPKIEEAKVKEIVEADGDFVVIDFRTLREYNKKHASIAKLCLVGLVEDMIGDLVPNKDTVVLGYCKSGGKSEIGLKKMAALGYKNLYNFSSLDNWPFEIEGEEI